MLGAPCHAPENCASSGAQNERSAKSLRKSQVLLSLCAFCHPQPQYARFVSHYGDAVKGYGGFLSHYGVFLSGYGEFVTYYGGFVSRYWTSVTESEPRGLRYVGVGVGYGNRVTRYAEGGARYGHSDRNTKLADSSTETLD